VEIVLTRDGRPLEAGDFGLVSLEPHGSLVALRLAESGLYRARAARGRYLLFEGSRVWGEVAVPGSVALALDLRRVVVHWILPALDRGEAVRGEVSVLPKTLSVRPDLRERFLAATRTSFRASFSGPPTTLLLGAPGECELVGLSDLGSFSVILPAGAVSIHVPLYRRRP
jgi:hypothetical protein